MAMARMAEMKARDSSARCIRPSLALRWAGPCRCRAVPCGALRATCGSPGPAKHLLEDGIDDVIGAALDEPSVIFEEFVDRLLELTSRVMIPGAFLIDRHSFLLW